MPFKSIEKQRQKNRNYHLAHKEEINARRKRNYYRLHEHELQQAREYKILNYEKVKMKERKYQVAQYGITLEEYNRLFILQNGKCAICSVSQDKSLDVDHCHKTNKVRGLLCRKCNLGIGFMQDNPEICKKASEYLS
jgi:hypothetical protein